jgi:hypothetical protein
MRWAERRANNGDVASAIAHFGRALEYSTALSAFGKTRAESLTEALREALHVDPVADDQILTIGNCTPDERAFLFLAESDLTESTFDHELASALIGIANTSRLARGRVLGLLSHVATVLFDGIDLQSLSTIQSCHARVMLSGGVMRRLARFLVVWLSSLTESDCTSQREARTWNRFACEIAYIMHTIHNAAERLHVINDLLGSALPHIPIRAVGIDASTESIFYAVSELLSKHSYPDGLKMFIQGIASDLPVLRTKDKDILEERSMNRMNRKLPPSPSSPSLRLKIRCKCPGFNQPNLSSRLKAAFASLYPKLEVGEISVRHVLRWTKSCDVDYEWTDVPLGMEEDYKETALQVVKEVLGDLSDHFDILGE